jgi:serine/threonine protein phosphatase PrpC
MQAEAAACPGEVGTTASLALLTGRRRLSVATCGDSLCVLYADAGADRLQGRVLTASHRLSSNPDEQRRIRDIEPWAVTCFGGEQRVCGALNMSRSLGDAHLHPFVTHDPELWEGVLTPADRYLVLATDGVWDVLGPDAVGDLLARARGRIRERGDAARADLARLVCRAALRAGSRDNVAAVVADPLAP